MELDLAAELYQKRGEETDPTATKEEEEEEESSDEDEGVIPKRFAVRSKFTTKYLRYINEDKQLHGFLQYSGERVVSPYTKFHVEISKNGKGHVHIRCSYNNKYWGRLSSDSNYIVAVANQPEEDVSKWSCTLFEPVYDADYKGFRFRHVQLDCNLYLSKASEPYTNCLVAATNGEYVYAISTVVDWDSIFILPKHVAFRVPNGDGYLKFIDPYLQFSGTDNKVPSASHEIFPTSDGNIRIKNDESSKFWIRDPNWIFATSTDTTSDDPNTLFWPVKVAKNIVALRNLGNDRFCTRLTTEGKTNCLNAAVETIIEEARMEVTEVVVSRVIKDVDYRVKDARIYGSKVLTMSIGDAINKTKETDTITFKFSYEKKKKKNWTSSISTVFGFSTKFKAGVPVVGEGDIKVNVEAGEEYTWGDTEKVKELVEVTHAVTIPPMSRVKISGIIKQGSCDVPFSYTQIDTLRNGRQVRHRLNDGIFSGFNSYDFKFETKNVPL